MGQRITASLEVPATMRSVLDSLVEITGAERACIMLRDPDSGLLEFATGRNLDATGVAERPEHQPQHRRRPCSARAGR